MKVFKARSSYRPSEPFLPWFHRILRNTCYSFLRKHRRVQQVSLSSSSDEDGAQDYEILDLSAGPFELATQREGRELIGKALARLSARDREILALRHHEELSYKEIAMTLGIPQGTVMSRLYHARRRLRDVLGSKLNELSPQDSSDSGR